MAIGKQAVLTLPDAALMVFEPMFTQPVRRRVRELVTGAIPCRGPRTVTRVLRTLSLSDEPGFCAYHRVLSRARWSGLLRAKILLGLLVGGVVRLSYPVIIVVDETLERRKGQRIKAKGYYRDAVRSTPGKVVKCAGLKWISLMALVPLPWNPRPWALPFLTLLAPSERANQAANDGNYRPTTARPC